MQSAGREFYSRKQWETSPEMADLQEKRPNFGPFRN